LNTSQSPAQAVRKPAKTKAIPEPKISFIKMEPIIEIIRAVIWTSRIADEKPVSCILVAEQESAKTEALKYFTGTKSLLYMSDITSRGLSPYKHDIEAGRIRHLVLLDLVRVLEHAGHVTNRTIQMLASLMEEGESESSDAGGSTKWSNFPRIGVLAGVTPAFFKSHGNKWKKSGFMSRFLPLRFHYSRETISLVHEAIARGHKLPIPHPEQLFEFPVSVTIPEHMADIVRNKSIILGRVNKIYGFRYHRALRALCKAEAARNKRAQVNESDLNRVLGWSDFFTGEIVDL
jgi:hypothetical protein